MALKYKVGDIVIFHADKVKIIETFNKLSHYTFVYLNRSERIFTQGERFMDASKFEANSSIDIDHLIELELENKGD